MLYLHPLTQSTHYAKLYPQSGARIVTIDYVTSFHPMYTQLQAEICWQVTLSSCQRKKDTLCQTRRAATPSRLRLFYTQ